MFTDLYLKNFKGWQDTGDVRLAPITVLFGSNSSGKTSLLQSVLLLKQTAESSDRSRVLHTGDEKTLIDLGTVSDVVFGHDLTQTLEVTVGWTLPQPLKITGISHESLQFSLQVGLTPEGQPFVNLARYSMGDSYAVLKKLLDGRYDLKSHPALQRGRGRPPYLPAPIRFYGFPDEVRNYFKKADWLSDLALELERQLARVQYVGPLRQYAKRSYLWSGEKPLNVGTLGELAVPAMLAAQAEHLEIAHGEGKGKRYEPFVEAIARWLKQLGVIDSFRLERIGKRKDYEVRVKRSPGSAEVLVTDVGVGVSQVLPVVVQSFYARRGSTVIFEQPEIHLHPRVQAELADVLLEAWRLCGVQFIVESHSEHFLRRLQRRVAEEAVNKDDVALYVCEVKEGRSQIETLKMDEDGNITNWPRDFFGDEVGDLAAMTEAAIRRRKKS